MEAICKQYFSSFKKTSDEEVCGVIKSTDNYNNFTRDLNVSGFSYSIRTSRISATNAKDGCDLGTSKLLSRPFRFDSATGVPYTYGQSAVLNCIHGNLYYKINKPHDKQDHPTKKKSRTQNQSTKKLGCPSKLIVKIRRVFSDYASPATTTVTKWMKEKICQELKEKVVSDTNVKRELWYYITASIFHNHLITGKKLPLHPQLVARIEELVQNGVTSTAKIKVQLHEKVKEMFGETNKPDCTNSAFYPEDTVIYSHAHRKFLKENPLLNLAELCDSEEPLELMEPDNEVVIEQCPEQTNIGESYLPVLRDQLRNIIDTTYNLEEGDYLISYIEEAAGLDRKLKSHLKRSQDHFVLLDTISKMKNEEQNYDTSTKHFNEQVIFTS